MSTKLCGIMLMKKSPKDFVVSISTAGRLRASMLVLAKKMLATTNAMPAAIISMPTNPVSVFSVMRSAKPLSSPDVNELTTAHTKYGISSISSLMYASATSPAKPDTAGNNLPTITASIAAKTICHDSGMLRFFTIIEIN